MRLVLAVAALGIVTAVPAHAQGDSRAGRAIAQRSCVQCHDIEAGDRDNFRIAPAFQIVADDPAITEATLRTFFETPHVNGQSARLKPGEKEDVLTYILTLKRSRPRG